MSTGRVSLVLFILVCLSHGLPLPPLPETSDGAVLLPVTSRSQILRKTAKEPVRGGPGSEEAHRRDGASKGSTAKKRGAATSASAPPKRASGAGAAQDGNEDEGPAAQNGNSSEPKSEEADEKTEKESGGGRKQPPQASEEAKKPNPKHEQGEDGDEKQKPAEESKTEPEVDAKDPREEHTKPDEPQPVTEPGPGAAAKPDPEASESETKHQPSSFDAPDKPSNQSGLQIGGHHLTRPVTLFGSVGLAVALVVGAFVLWSNRRASYNPDAQPYEPLGETSVREAGFAVGEEVDADGWNDGWEEEDWEEEPAAKA